MFKSDKEVWIFLSHSNEDYEKVRRIRNILEEMNTRPLMFFLKCLSDNDEIEDLIKREIEARTRFILCDSENARNSNWVAKEVEYITKLQKPYDVIDVSENDELIRERVKNCFRKEHIFISYPRELLPAVKIVYERLSKYDFCTSFIDMFDISAGIPFWEDFESNIEKAVSHGVFVSLLCNHSLLKGRVSQYELETALKYDTEYKAILPVYLETEAKSYFLEKLNRFEGIDLTNANTPHGGFPNSKDIPYRHGNMSSEMDLKKLGDDITNAILVRLQGWGNIQTYAENFRFGRGINKDTDEADKLGRLTVEHLEKVDCGNHFNGPGMLICLGNLFKNGKVVKQDFAKALDYYREAYREFGVAIDYLISDIPSEFL